MPTPDLLQAPHHIGIVVHDIDRSTAFYESIGVGPWRDFPSLEPYTHDLSGIGKAELLDSRFKYTTVGALQLQLCQPAPGDSPQRRFLEEHGEGVFSLSFSVPDIDQGQDQLTAAGLTALLRGRTAHGNGFTYFDTRPHGAGAVLQIRSAS